METQDGVPFVVEMKFPISNFTKIRRLGAALVHADGMTKVIDTPRKLTPTHRTIFSVPARLCFFF